MALRREVVPVDALFEETRELFADLAEDRKIALRTFNLMKAVRRDPFGGIGKPEPLRHLGPDIWSRRITARDRLVYRVGHDFVDFLQARYHY